MAENTNNPDKLNPERDYTEQELQTLTPDKLNQLKVEVEKKAQTDATKVSLLELIKKVESQRKTETWVESKMEIPAVSMDSFKSKVKSWSMLRMLSSENIPEWLKSYKPEPKSLFDLFATQKLLKTAQLSWLELSDFWPLINYWDSIKMVMWKRLINAFDTASFWDMAVNVASWAIGINWDKINITDIKTAFSDLKWFSKDSFDPSKKWKLDVYNIETGQSTTWVVQSSIDIPNSVLNLFEKVEKLVDKDCENLVKLVKTAKKNNLTNDWNFKKLLASPNILYELLEKWTYTWNWFDIDLPTNKLEIKEEAKSFDVKSAQEAFMNELAWKTDEAWKPLDKAIENVNQLAKTIKDWTWYDVKDLEKLIEDLSKEHPLLWWILKIIFWMFFPDKEAKEVEKTTMEDPRKISLENLIKFKNEKDDNKKYLPNDFKLEKEDDIKSFDTFFNIINQTEENRISSLPQDQKVNNTNEIIKWPNFWKDILTWVGLTKWTMMFKISEKIKSIMWKNPQPNMQEFIKEINQIKPEDIQNEDKSRDSNTESGEHTANAQATVAPNPSTKWNLPLPTHWESTTVFPIPQVIKQELEPKKNPEQEEAKLNTQTPEPPKQVETTKIPPLEEQLKEITKNPTEVNYNWKTYKIGFSWNKITLWNDKFNRDIEFEVKVDLSSAIWKVAYLHWFNWLRLSWGKVLAIFETITWTIYEEPFSPKELEEKIISIIETNSYNKVDKNGVKTTITKIS